MTPRDEAISKAVQDAIKLWKEKYDKAMARNMTTEIKLSEMEEQVADVLNYETQLRDQFAVAAMNGIISGFLTDPSITTLNFLNIAEDAYTMADTIMSQREKQDVS